MDASSYHESLWQAVPEGADLPDLKIRRSFLLEHAERVRPRDGMAAPARVLDVGCGEGRLAGELLRAGFAVVGIDVAEEPLRRARRAHPDLDVRLVPVHGDWPLEDASFDLVWAGETIEHVPDTAGWLSEVRRVLRPGGILLLSTPAHGRLKMLALALSARAFDAHFDPRTDHLRFYSARTLALLLEDFGFEAIEVRAVGGLPGVWRTLLAAAVRSRF
jgi:2-polyprenyl-6-hydroxyphenyl methylase/3-demethylubiquinone-9 3-methyltransferase